MNEILKKFRLLKGLTQKDFAEKIGVSRATIAQIEAKNNNLSLEVLGKINKTFNINLNDFRVEQGYLINVNNNTLLPNDNIVKNSNWKNETVLEKNHFIFNIIDNYKTDIDEIEYFKKKIYTSFTILENLGKEADSSFIQFKEVLEKNLKDIKDIYSYFLIGSLTREDLLTNKEFLTEDQNKKLNNILDDTSEENWRNKSVELIQQSKNLLQLYKNAFDDMFELVLKYSEIYIPNK